MDEYSTRSVSLGAFIYLNEVRLISAIDAKGYDYFTFDDAGGCASRLAEQFCEDAPAPARTYSIALNQLRRESSDARKAR